eukprot:scaffold742_cov263-Pinguiococcus_pyrenoidosus.AAC.14
MQHCTLAALLMHVPKQRHRSLIVPIVQDAGHEIGVGPGKLVAEEVTRLIRDVHPIFSGYGRCCGFTNDFWALEADEACLGRPGRCSVAACGNFTKQRPVTTAQIDNDLCIALALVKWQALGDSLPVVLGVGFQHLVGQFHFSFVRRNVLEVIQLRAPEEPRSVTDVADPLLHEAILKPEATLGCNRRSLLQKLASREYDVFRPVSFSPEAQLNPRIA